MKKIQKFLPFFMLAIFEAIAVILWLSKDNLFYLFNFSYIGLFLSLGLFLYGRNCKCLNICFQKIPDHIFLDFFLCLRIRRQDHHIRMIFFRRIFHSVTDGQPVFAAFGFCDNTDGYLFLFCFLC